MMTADARDAFATLGARDVVGDVVVSSAIVFPDRSV